jgi:hypothetical protein
MKSPRQPEDPILSPAEMATDGNISEATWYRNYRYHPKLRIIQISPRRIGARQSNWRQVLEEQTEGAVA